jgi:hypothetical protein
MSHLSKVTVLFSISLIALVLPGCSSDPLLDIVAPNSPFTVPNGVQTTTLGFDEITSFDIYRDNNNLIHLIASGKLISNKQTGLRYSRYDVAGQSWLTPIQLGAQLPQPMSMRGNDSQIAGFDDYLVVVWQTKGEIPGMGPLVSAISVDKGKSWQQSVNPAANNNGDQSHLDLTADRHGSFHIAWLEDPEENGYQSLRYTQSSDHGKHWAKPTTLDNSTCSCCWNTFAASDENILTILYRDMKLRDMALMQSLNNGNNWMRVSTVGEFNWKFDGCPHVGGGLTYGAENNQLHSLVWTGVDKKAGLYYLRSNNNGSSWAQPKLLTKSGAHADIAADEDDYLGAVWDQMEDDGSTRVYFTSSEDSGTHWQPPIRLSSVEYKATHPRIVANENGFLVIWTEKKPNQPSHIAFSYLEK